MSFTLAGRDIARARVLLPQYGIWSATVTLAEPLELLPGTPVTLVLGDLTLAGTVVPDHGGTYVSESRYLIVGGSNGWSKPVKERPYRTDSGVPLGEVAADLAADAGERIVLEAGVERRLGYVWMRPHGMASQALEDLGVRWWMAPDGTTHLGPRPVTTVPSGVKFVVDPYDPTVRSARITTPDDSIAPFLPGAQFTTPELPVPFVVGRLEVRVEAQAIELEVWSAGAGAESILPAIITHIAERVVRTARLYPYRVTEQVGRRVSLQARDKIDGMPDTLHLDVAQGLGGAWAELAPSTEVLVGFEGRDFGRAYVAQILPGAPLPASINIDAGAVKLGGAAAAPLAIAGIVDLNFVALIAKINQIATAVGLGTMGSVTGTGTTKVTGE